MFYCCLSKYLLFKSIFSDLFASTDYQAAASADQGSFPGLPQWRYTNCGWWGIHQCCAKLQWGKITPYPKQHIANQIHFVVLGWDVIAFRSITECLALLRHHSHQVWKCSCNHFLFIHVIWCSICSGILLDYLCDSMPNCLYLDDRVVKWWLKLCAAQIMSQSKWLTQTPFPTSLFLFHHSLLCI